MDVCSCVKTVMWDSSCQSSYRCCFRYSVLHSVLHEKLFVYDSAAGGHRPHEDTDFHHQTCFSLLKISSSKAPKMKTNWYLWQWPVSNNYMEQSWFMEHKHWACLEEDLPVWPGLRRRFNSRLNDNNMATGIASYPRSPQLLCRYSAYARCLGRRPWHNYLLLPLCTSSWSHTQHTSDTQ